MSFRNRLTVVAAAAVAVAIALASAGAYATVRSVLRGEVDDRLAEQHERISTLRAPLLDDLVVAIPPRPFGGQQTFLQVVRASGSFERLDRPGQVGLRPRERAVRVAAGFDDAYFDDIQVGDTHLRVLTAPLARDLAVQLALPLDDVDRTLRRLAFVLAAFALGGIALGAVLGRAVAVTALRPVRRLSEATEHVAATQDLGRRIETRGRDELSRLGASFNTMLEALGRSLGAQRQLVADASHELRTPLTSLRTNVEVLARAGRLPKAERERLLADIVDQLEELTVLVADVVELARGHESEPELEDVRLDLLVADAVERAARHAPDVRFDTTLEPSVVRGVPPRLARAIGNLLDNAAKWSPPDGAVEVAVRDGEVTVRDHGPGIDDADLPRVFDRFYRAPAARGTPGSGLGLAIVRQVAEAHGGRVSAERPEGGGTLLRLQLLDRS